MILEKLRYFYNFLPRLSYAQNGEDIILKRLFHGKKNGFYVDIGAHHPMRFSNTYLFYRAGWNGINIDASADSIKLFKYFRQRDTNILSGVGFDKRDMIYYRFNESALNTFSFSEAIIKDVYPNKIIEKVSVSVDRLDNLLDIYLPQGKDIDFLTVDVEGFDLEVLRSNNWDLYRPKILLLESLESEMVFFEKSPLSDFMTTVGYKPYCKAYNTNFFLRDDADKYKF